MDLAVGTINKRMAELRWWAEEILEQNVIARVNDHCGSRAPHPRASAYRPQASTLRPYFSTTASNLSAMPLGRLVPASHFCTVDSLVFRKRANTG